MTLKISQDHQNLIIPKGLVNPAIGSENKSADNLSDKPFSQSLYDPGDLENLVKVTKI